MTLTPEESSKFTIAANLSWAQRRLVVRMSLRHLGVPMLCAEGQQRRQEASLVSMVAPDKLEAKKMLLYRTTASEFPSLQGAVKVVELAPYFTHLVQQVIYMVVHVVMYRVFFLSPLDLAKDFAWLRIWPGT